MDFLGQLQPKNVQDTTFNHQTVMPKEALSALNIKKDGVYVDGTFGGGGHSKLILESLGEKGRLIVFDRDPESLKAFKVSSFINDRRLFFIEDNFANMSSCLLNEGIEKVDGVLLDLGLSSHQLFNSGRGFSFLNEEEPLDMRMDPKETLTVAEVVNSFTQTEIANIIYEYGEERASRRIAKAIVYARQKDIFKNVGQLAHVVSKSLWRPGRPPRIHLATKTFMALRIFINDELGALKKILKEAPSFIKPGGYISIISFHSLEDRIVKNVFRDKNEDGYGYGYWSALTKKPQVPSLEEIKVNPRSRSAKHRAAERSELKYA